jgi:hypothetical protein
MMNKELFIQTCLVKGISITKAENAWKRILNIKEHIGDHFAATQKLQDYSKQEKLAFREKAAEMGAEFTPNELTNLITVLGLIQKGKETEILNYIQENLE